MELETLLSLDGQEFRFKSNYWISLTLHDAAGQRVYGIDKRMEHTVKRRHKVGTFAEFKDFTLAIARGERKVDPKEPKVWYESTDESGRIEGEVLFASVEAGAKLLSAKNRALLRVIATRRPKSVSELASLTGRAEQNVLRTLHKMSAAGLVRLHKGAGRAYQPEVVARRVHFEIDLLS